MSNKLPETGFVRLSQILGDPKADPPIKPLIPISRTTWWQGVREGRFPKPSKQFGCKIAAYRVEDVQALLDGEFSTETGGEK